MCNRRNDSDQEHVPAVLSRREALKAGAAAAIMTFFGGANSIAQATEAASASAGKVRDAATEWLSYGGDKASSKYSPLAQISGGNFNRLQTAWTWQSAEEEVAKANHLKTCAWESTPLMRRRRALYQHFALPGRGHRRRDGQDPLGVRPGDMEERNTFK